jgi:hypothetical protein
MNAVFPHSHAHVVGFAPQSGKNGILRRPWEREESSRRSFSTRLTRSSWVLGKKIAFLLASRPGPC